MLSQKTRKIIFVIIFIQIASLLFLALNNSTYTWDEASYIINAIDIANEPINPIMQNYIAHERHPLLSWIIAGMLFVGLPSFFYKILSIISFTLFALLIYIMGSKFYNKDVGLITAFIFMTIPTIVFLSTKILSDIHGALLFSLCLYLYYKGLKQPKYFLWGGFVGGISIIMRDMNVLLIPILSIFGVLFWKKLDKKDYFLSIPIALASLTPYFIDNYLRWGNPLFRILKHIEMVKASLGYQTFSIQSMPVLWLIFLPLFIGIPIFILFIIHIYKNKKECFRNNNLKFLLIWFFVPFFIFILRQKITPRLIIIFIVPVLLLGARELLKRKNFKIWLAIILIVNGLFVFNAVVFMHTSIFDSHKETFNFILSNIPENETIYSNTSPPSVLAWYTHKTIIFELNPDQNPNSDYYVYDKTYERYINRTKINFNNYNILFNNSKFIVAKKK